MLTRVTASIQQLCGVQREAQVHGIDAEGTRGRVSGQVSHRALQLQAQQLHHGVQQRLLACGQQGGQHLGVSAGIEIAARVQ